MKRLLLSALAGVALAACSSRQTPQANLATSVAATLAAGSAGGGGDVTPATEPAQPPSATPIVDTGPAPTPTLGPIPLSGTALPTAVQTGSPLPGPTAVPITSTRPAPTPAVFEVVAVYQVFQNGRMLWLADRGEIWVMIGRTTGPYKVFPDQFREGDPETDPGLTPPPGYLQPKRGFARIWRDNPDLRAQIGWATDWEFAYSARATRTTIGAFDGSGNFTPAGDLWAVYLGDGSLAYFNAAAGMWAVQARP